MSGSATLERPAIDEDGWKKAREDELAYHLGLLREGWPDNGVLLDGRLLAVLTYLQDADELLCELGRVVFTASNEAPKVTFEQIGLLLGWLNDCKTQAKGLVDYMERMEEATLVDLYRIAGEGQQPNLARFDKHGGRQRSS